MKITSFNPLILTPKPEETISFFESIGFERRHMKTGINGKDIVSVSMRDANGFHVDVTKVESLPQDWTVIRVNVDDFDEAYQFLLDRGFKNTQGDKFTDTGSSKATLMISPSGYGLSIAQHIKS